MRCKCCDYVGKTYLWKGDFYCLKCVGAIKDTIRSYPPLRDKDNA